MPACAVLLEPRGSVLRLPKFTFNAENFNTGCLGLTPAVSAQFTLKMCAAVQNREKFIQNPYFGGSKSFKAIDVDKSKNSVTTACYDI